MGFGDDLMVSGRARVLQATDPRKVRVMLGPRAAWSEVWENNPRFAKLGERGDFQILYARHPEKGNRPYHTGRVLERWLYNLEFRADVGELYLSDAEKQFAVAYDPEILIEPNVKPAASPNKQWGWERWETLASILNGRGFRLYQVGKSGTRTLEHATFIPTVNFRLGCAVLERARFFVGGEGGLHHAAAALGVPGVVIFGGFTPIELTGYPIHRNLGVSLGDACGMREPCGHCAEIMASITPEQVAEELCAAMRVDVAA